jgi:2-polyprenyl-3-methyl-5-hydroxy-6-metoxy-1,4-benzoquinol methylase
MSFNLVLCECCKTKMKKRNIRDQLSYYCCTNCGHCIKTQDSDLYKQDFEFAQKKYFSDTTHLLNSVPSTNEKEILNLRVKIANRLLDPKSRVIEVGPGSGFFASYLIERNHFVILSEHSSVLANSLRLRLDTEVIIGEFDHSMFNISHFDVFCSFHVIEHVIDPFQHMHSAYKVTRPGGIALIATPNSRSWQQRFMPSLSPNYDSAHLRVFSKDSLLSISYQAGWELKEIFTPEYSTAWLRVITKIIRKIRKQDEEETAGKYASNSFFAKTFFLFFTIISMPVRKIQEILGGGNEIFLVLKKPENRLV